MSDVKVNTIGFFEKYLERPSLFINKQTLQSTFLPENAIHRDEQIERQARPAENEKHDAQNHCGLQQCNCAVRVCATFEAGQQQPEQDHSNGIGQKEVGILKAACIGEHRLKIVLFGAKPLLLAKCLQRLYEQDIFPYVRFLPFFLRD